jgi:cyclase
MLKKRIIPVLLLTEGRMVKGRQFSAYRETGLPRTTVRIYSAQDADELCFINIDPSPAGFESLVSILNSASEECFMPLTAGGGIQNIEQIQELFKVGADKVLITSHVYRSKQILSLAARQFGSQSLVAGIDYYETSDGPVVAIDRGKTRVAELDIQSYAFELQAAGAGEIFLNCITRDGMMKGYDLDTASLVANAVTVPVVACGGAANYQDLADVLALTGVSAAACSSVFHFGDNNPIRARSYLRNAGIPMRELK